VASLQDIRRRITSVKNTRKITKALELVAGARLRRAQMRIEEMRPYADRMQELMAGTSRAAASFRNLALLQRREVKKVAVLVVTGDRGLAGPFNGQVLRRAFELERAERAEGHQIDWLVAGRKGTSTLRFRRYHVKASWAGFADKPKYSDAQAIAHTLAELYSAEEVDRVVLVYNRYVSPLVQRVTVTDLASQMTAMRNASKNAGELIDSLTLAMNRARQAEITQEILEVVAGADALSG
jgi:F-type H+-transporting ATPase subunit gamma